MKSQVHGGSTSSSPRTRWVILAMALALGCAARQVAADAPLHVEARLVQTSATTFRLSARLSRPVTRLPFTRPGDGDRLRNFRVIEPPGARLHAQGKDEEVISTAPFDRVVLDATVHRHLPDRDYAPFFPLSGGGVFVYTGQFDLGEQKSTRLSYEFEALAGESALVPGGVARRGSLPWRAEGDGTYVAFSPIEPVDEARFVAVIDTGFPARLRQEARALLPRLFDHYAVALGLELPFKPAVLLSHGEGEPGVISMKGGTLPGLLQQDVLLGADRSAADDAEVLSVFRQALAHESAHLWNTRLAPERDTEWVHEGGADLLSWRALRALGLFSGAELAERLSWAASVCALLRGNDGLQRDPTQAFYACGAIAEAVASNGESPGPERVWKLLLPAARARGSYDARMFFDACVRAGSPPRTCEAGRALTDPAAGTGSARVTAALREAKFAVSNGVAPERFARLAAQAGKGAASFLKVGMPSP